MNKKEEFLTAILHKANRVLDGGEKVNAYYIGEFKHCSDLCVAAKTHSIVADVSMSIVPRSEDLWKVEFKRVGREFRQPTRVDYEAPYEKEKTLLYELISFTEECREDMQDCIHQGITAKVVGTALDNSFGDRLMHESSLFQEMVLVLKKTHNGEEEEGQLVINMANLIALARRAKFE